MGQTVTDSDRMAITDLLARYCWHLDEGEAEEWVALWTPDGAFAGASPEPIRGREALKQISVRSQTKGVRHALVNIIAEYGDSDDEAIVRCYNLVTDWLDGANFNCMAIVRYHLVRTDGRWLIRSNQIRRMMPAGADLRGFPEGFPYPADQPTRFPPV